MRITLINVKPEVFATSAAPSEVACGALGFLRDLLVYGASIPPSDFRAIGVLQGLWEPGPFGIELRGRLSRNTPIVTYTLFCDGRDRGSIISETLQYRHGNSGAPTRVIEFVEGSGRLVANEFSWSCRGSGLEYRQMKVPQGRLALFTAMQDGNFVTAKQLGNFLLYANDRHSPAPVVTLVSKMVTKNVPVCE